MIERLRAWARTRMTRPGLLVRRALGTPLADDEALGARLSAALLATRSAPGLAATAWRVIELMDLGAVPVSEFEGLLARFAAPRSESLPLRLPSGAEIVDAESARIAGEALALRALTKGHHEPAELVARRDEFARRGPGFEGVTRRASALHGIAAAAVRYPTAVTRLSAELAAAQRGDGTWEHGDLFHVGQALLAVEHPEATRALRRGVGTLASLQGEDGGFGSEERSWIACRWLLRVGG